MSTRSMNSGRVAFLLAVLVSALACAADEREVRNGTSGTERAEVARRALLVNPDTNTAAGSLFVAGLRHAEASRYDSALAAMERASDLYARADEWRMFVAAANRVGETLSATGSYQRAAEHMEAVLETGRRELAGDDPLLGETFYNLGINSRRYGELDGAKTYLREALSVQRSALGDRHPKVADVYNELGTVHQILGDYERAIAFNELAGSIFRSSLGDEAPEVAESYNSLAITHAIKGDYDRALESFLTALSILRSTLGDGHARTANAYNNIAIVHAYRGDYQQATAFFNKALANYRATVGEKTLEAGNTYDNLGEIHYLMGDYERAQEYHDRALEIRRGVFGEDNIKVAMSYHNLAGDHWKQGNLGTALDFADRALALRGDLVGQSHPLVADTYLRLGGIRRDAGDYDGAARAYDRALTILRAAFGRHHPEVAEVYNQLAATRAEQGEVTLALEMVSGAIRANIPTLLDDDLSAEPPLNGVLSEEKLLISLERKADLLRRRYSNSSNVDDLEASVASYRHATRLMDQMRSGYLAGGSKLLLAERASELYERAIRTALQLHRLTGEEGLEAAFFFSEKSKAGILLEAFTELEARRIAGIPDSLLDRERQVQVDLSAYRNSLAQERLRGERADSAKISLWQGKVLELERESERLLARFERDYPNYHDLKYRFTIAPVSQIQDEILTDERVLVEYFVGSDSVYIFSIDTEGLAVVARAKGPDLEAWISQLRTGITNHDYGAYSDAAFRLYQALLQPVEERLGDRLLIVPDGVLNYLPFEALLSEAPSTRPAVIDYRELPYVLKRHSMTYAYSATLAVETRSRQRSEPRRDLLAYAPVFEGGVAAGSRGSRFIRASREVDTTRALPGGYLPATRYEVGAVEELFTDSYGLLERWLGRNTEVYLGDRANESNLKGANLEDYRYLHFATHGFTNEQEPALSGLLLAPAEGSDEDGVLHLGEIYNLRLNAELVVLSACETGVGRLARGEGLLGLTRGFLYAGASNLLVSLWQVNDASTSSLMLGFYGALLDGRAKADALREAKLRMLETPRDADPYHWAPFILIGS